MKTFVLFCFAVFIFGVKVECLDNKCTISNTSRIFLDNFVSNFSGTDTISLDRLKTIVYTSAFSNKTVNITTCSGFSEEKERKECLLNHCISIEDILRLHSIPTDKLLTVEDVFSITPDLLYQMSSCRSVEHHKKIQHHKKSPPMEQAWGYGFLFVTVINICSLSGAVVLPCMKKTYYQKVLIFMVALAVGSLAASGLLVLIPEAYGLMYTEDHEISDLYVWKASTIAGGIYLFFLIERFLKIILKIKQTTTHSHGHEYIGVSEEPNEEEHQYPSIKRNTPVNVSNRYKDTKNLPISMHTSKSETSFASTKPLENASYSMESFDALDKNDTESNGIPNGHTKGKEIEKKKQVATVAWMIIFGDGLHNFIDGLTIGAAFTNSILAGISICVSVFCEELPHELGDFAILLNSGMTVKRALMYNFLSACMCYLGLIVGTILGENTTAHDWVFAIAGGMFLYISLVDMMPEMNSAAESEENKKTIGPMIIFLLQNVGLIAGFGVILLMAVYGADINFEK